MKRASCGMEVTAQFLAHELLYNNTRCLSGSYGAAGHRWVFSGASLCGSYLNLKDEAGIHC